MTRREREGKLRAWFGMWLGQAAAGIGDLFAPNIDQERKRDFLAYLSL